MTDMAGRFLRINSAAERHLGRSPAELEHMSVFDIVHPDDAGKCRDMYASLTNAPEPVVSIMRFTHGDGDIRYMEWHAQFSGGRIYAVARDVTKRIRREEALLKATEQAIAANRVKSDFLSNVSHEVRTPLNGVLGMAQVLEKTPLSDEQKKYVGIIKSCSDGLLAVVNDILDISKIESGKLVLNRERFSIDDVVKRTFDVVDAAARKKKLQLSYEREFSGPDIVLGDELRLKQILVNLVGNAVKFTDDGAVSVRVSRLQSGLLRFEVRDTGPGIPESQHRLIFNRFTQADTSSTRKSGGTGLGLSISKELVLMMGGDIGVESAPGKGATFWFTLALATAPGQPARAEAVERRLL